MVVPGPLTVMVPTTHAAMVLSLLADLGSVCFGTLPPHWLLQASLQLCLGLINAAQIPPKMPGEQGLKSSSQPN